jgi:UDP-3-O-[3-hydroxymyristoyl] N-acetylglucosamine deacetylase
MWCAEHTLCVDDTTHTITLTILCVYLQHIKHSKTLAHLLLYRWREVAMNQTTIKKSIACSGVGLHSGKTVRMVLHPAAEDTGIVFDIHTAQGVRRIAPEPQVVIATGLATTLGMDGASVATVEHLLAAIRGLEIDNITVEIEGGEVPIMDGSAASFVMLLRNAGIRRQTSARKVFRIARPVHYERDGKSIRALPYDGFRVEYRIEFPHPLIGRQTLSIDITPESFGEIAKARTFGFLREVEYLHSKGLALGGSLDNAIVLDDYSVLNPDGLRSPDEFVRHKVLDFVGDMAMMGVPLQGHFIVECSGHALNNGFLRMLEENASLYLEAVELPVAEQHPAALRPAARVATEGQPAIA